MSRAIAPFGLRIPPDLRETLEAASKNNKRSLTAEIIDRLEYTVDDEMPYPTSHEMHLACSFLAGAMTAYVSDHGAITKKDIRAVDRYLKDKIDLYSESEPKKEDK